MQYLEPLSDIYSGGSPAATLGLLSFTVIRLILIRVGDINILQIIVFTPEVDNGALGSIYSHYKCRHIIAALHANVTVDYLGDIYVHLRGHS